jgi:uncharacterized protein YndB with AHSA1/START domain
VATARAIGSIPDLVLNAAAATSSRLMPVPPEAVWDVLADPFAYADWVVGSRAIRDADDGFPAPGTRFHHAVGVGPLTVSDHTEVLEAEAPHRMLVRAKARPLGTATIELALTPAADGGTLVRLSERPDGLYAPLALNPFVHVATRLRNAESLRRLERLALARRGA